MTPSIWQLLIVLVIVLLLFGRGKIPQLMGDIVREELKDKGIALISSHLDKPRVMCIITKDICEVLDAGNIIRNIADKIGLKGGGSKHFAMINLLDKNLLDKSIKIGLDIINKRCSEYAN